MTDTANREAYEKAVVERLKASGFLEIEIRVEALVRHGDGYFDEIVNTGWHYWSAARKEAIEEAANIAESYPTRGAVGSDFPSDERAARWIGCRIRAMGEKGGKG